MAATTNGNLRLNLTVSRSGKKITWLMTVTSVAYAYSDNQTLNWSGANTGSYNYFASSAWGETKTLASRSVTITGNAGQTYSLTAWVSGAFDGSAPQVSNVSITIPVDPPAAPSNASVTRNSDTSATVSFTRNATTGAPYKRVYIDRWSQSSNTYTRVATITSASTSWNDLGIKANDRYRYRISSNNDSGTSGFTYTGYISTTPMAPNSVSAAKTGSNIIVTWNNRANYQTGSIIYDNGVQIGTVGAGVSTFTHSSPNTLITHTYTVRATVTGPTLQSALSSPSNTVQLTAPPNAPTTLSMPKPIYSIESDTTARLSWKHNPVDSSTQTQARVEYRVPGSATWHSYFNGSLTAQFRDISWTTIDGTHGVLAGNFIFRVSTKGLHVDWSPWSGNYTVARENEPVITPISPASATTITTSSVTLVWNYSQAQSKAQASTHLVLLENGTQVYSFSRNGTSTSLNINYSLKDDHAYVARLSVIASNSLPSEIILFNFSVDYVEPAPPTMVGQFIPELGANEITFFNKAGAIATQFNRVYRNVNPDNDWYILGENLVLIDPKTNTYTNPDFEDGTAIPAGAEQSLEWFAQGNYSLYVPDEEEGMGYGFGSYGGGPYGV